MSNQVTNYQGGLSIKALLRDDFKNNKQPFQTTPKKSSSSSYLGFTIILYKYGVPDLPTYHKRFCPNFFLGESMDPKYPTYLHFRYMSKLS